MLHRAAGRFLGRAVNGGRRARSEALRTRLLTHAYQSWWQSLQLPFDGPTMTDLAAWAPPAIIL
jgi:hypothetical protein